MKLKIQQAKKRILRPTGARLTRFDPTQTTTLRNTFGAEINRYFAHLRRCINELFTEEDALGLKSPKPVTNVFCPTGKGGGIDPTCSPPNKNTLAIMEKYKDEQAWKEPIEEYMESVGLTLGDYNKVNELLYQHNLSSGEESDIALSNLWNSQDSPGRALREFSKWNEWQSLNSSREKPDWSYARKQIARNPSSYKMFEGGSVSDSVDRFKEYMQATERGEPIFYRKGGLDRNAVSTTTSRTGARSGGSHFIPDRWFSFQELKNAGYHLISGARGMVGVTSSQEREHIWLKPRETPVANTRWKYLDSQGKVKAFATWLRYMNYLWMKGTYGSNQKAWPTKKPMEDLWKDYINAGFAKGAGRSFDDVRKQTKGLKKSLDWYNGNREEFLRSSFAAPESVDKVKLLVSQGFSELEGVTKDAEIRLTRKLADGLVQGQHPKSIAKTIADDLDISRKRALRIAHTELIRAHAGGQLISLKRLGVEKVGVAVEWSTARDEKVCPLCKALAGIVLSIDEAWGLIPRHPGCRCAFVPAVIAELHMIRTKSAIEAALKLSSKKGKGTWKWPTISKDRPSLVSVENAATIPYTRGIAVIDRFLINQKENCGTGAGGFKEGNTCWKNKKSFLAAKSALLSYLQDEENNYASSGVIKSHLGASAEEISEVLKELSEEGLIDTYGGSDPSTSSLSSGLAIGKKNIYGIQLTDKGKEYADTPFAEELATDEADETPLADLFDETPSLPEEPPAKVAEISLDDLFAEDAFDEAPVASPIFPEPKTEEPKPEPKAKTPEGYSPTNPLHSPEGISDYVASKFKEAGVVALTPAFIAKVKKMNPHGISGGVYKTPWVDKWQLPILKKVLPWNTKIKQGTFDSATNDLKKTYSTKKFGGDVFTTEAAPATPEVKPQAPPKPAKTIQASLLPTPPKLPKYNSQPELAQKNQEAINELTELAKKGDLKAIEPFLSHPSKWVNSYASGLKDSIQEQLGEKPPPYEHLEQVGEVEYATTEELKAAMLPYLPSISSGGKVKFAHSPAIDKKAQESWKAKLTASEKSAISSWKGSPSEIRESIAKGKPTPQAKAILSAMDKAKAHQGILYRGVHSEYADKIMAQIDDAGVGCLWSDAAPHGMSPNPAVASKFSYGKVLFRIIAKTAKPIWKEDGYSGDGYDSLSEKECLGYPGRKYKVTGIYQDVTIGDNKGTNMPYSQIKRVIDLEEI